MKELKKQYKDEFIFTLFDKKPKLYRMQEEEQKSPSKVTKNHIITGDDNSFDEDGFQDIDDNLCEVRQQMS
tara:strand:- start:141 stop:353 length:213 start_codon:yes stop_codon:yes gene_type:complete